jgi:hypothetical protein
LEDRRAGFPTILCIWHANFQYLLKPVQVLVILVSLIIMWCTREDHLINPEPKKTEWKKYHENSGYLILPVVLVVLEKFRVDFSRSLNQGKKATNMVHANSCLSGSFFQNYPTFFGWETAIITKKLPFED